MTLVLSKTEHHRDPQPEPSVRALQNRLITKGYNCGRSGADGQFGNDTTFALNRFKRHLGMKQDGRCDDAAWRELIKHTTKPTPAPAAGITTAAEMADLAYKLVTQGIDGTPPAYVFGAEANLTDPSPDRLDCSELVQWAVYQLTKNSWIDGSGSQYAGSAGHHVSVEEGIRTKGALLFLSGTSSPNAIHHVVISMGNGHTAEARSAHTHPQVGSWPATGRGFQFACLVPVLRY